MSSTGVSILMTLQPEGEEAERVRGVIERYLESTGLTYEVLLQGPRSGEGYGALVRRIVADARGDVIVIVDDDLPYAVEALGHAAAMIESGAADVVFGHANPETQGLSLLRAFLVDELPDPRIALQAFSRTAARLIIGESRLTSRRFALELAFLANKYGFRVERLHVSVPGVASRRQSFSAFSLRAVAAIRLTARRMGYRASRRCPVCFANEVWTAQQIPGNLVRACSRCKCRYLNQFADENDANPVRRVLRETPPAGELLQDGASDTAREKTAIRRMAVLRRHLSPRARVMEVGVRDGSFGLAAAREFEYVGIDPSPALARGARAKGLETYCATLGSFVNTGPSFDALALFHVLENIADPHDALGRIKDLLKPGGVLFLTTFDTESLMYLVTERKRAAVAFRTHQILYSRSALIELLEHSGFEIEVIGPDFDYRDHRSLRHIFATRFAPMLPVVSTLLRVMPDPLLVGNGSIRIIAKRRAGSSNDLRAISSTEATHAR